MLALNRNVGSMAGLLSHDVLACPMQCMIWLNLTNKRYKIPGWSGIYSWWSDGWLLMRTDKTNPEMCATREMLLPSFHGINRVSLVNYSKTKKEANDLPSALIFGRHVDLFNVQRNVFISRCFCRYQVLLSWTKTLVNLHATFNRALLLQTAHTTVLGPPLLLKA